MWWHILGVEAGADHVTVKKAYAKIIKDIDQDNNIDEFTKVHQAFRLAMKSFKNNHESEFQEKKSLLFEDETNYIEEMTELYNNEEKRLDPTKWKDFFACMSFKEEEAFALRYVSFFNEQYLLTDDIWEIIEIQYPLVDKKTFKWKDLCNGNFSISSYEIEKVKLEDRLIYVELKIHIFYHILNKEYDEAFIKIKEFMGRFNLNQMTQWLMVTTIELKNLKDVEKAYELMKKLPDYVDLGHYYYASFLYKQKMYHESLKVLMLISENNNYKMKLEDEIQFLIHDKTLDYESCLPWNELELCSKKKAKYLSLGNYQKAIKSETRIMKTILNRGGKA